MTIVKYDPDAKQKPSVMKKRRYPVTLIIATILGIPALAFLIAVGIGGAGASTKCILVGIVLFFYLGIVGLCFMFEGQEKGHW